jgi:hypothetical protein
VHEALVGVVAREVAQAGTRGGVDEGEREEVALRVAAAEARCDVAHGDKLLRRGRIAVIAIVDRRFARRPRHKARHVGVGAGLALGALEPLADARETFAPAGCRHGERGVEVVEGIEPGLVDEHAFPGVRNGDEARAHVHALEHEAP